MSRFAPKDYAGKTFGLVTAISRTSRKGPSTGYFWKVRCKCGTRFMSMSVADFKAWIAKVYWHSVALD